MIYKELLSILYLYYCRGCGGSGSDQTEYYCECDGSGIDKELNDMYPMVTTIIEIEEHDAQKRKQI